MKGSSGKGYFRAALSESGNAFAISLATALTRSVAVSAISGCVDADLACLRAVPMLDLFAADMTVPASYGIPGWNPTIDGVEIPRHPIASLRDGDVDTKGLDAFAAGVNTNEGTMFIYPYYPIGMDRTAYEIFASEFVLQDGTEPLSPSQLLTFNEIYPAPLLDGRDTASDVWGDGTFVGATRIMLRALEQVGVPVFHYHFDYRRPEECNSSPASWGVAHAGELPFVFANPLQITSLCDTFTDHGSAISEAMNEHWVSLASSGKPTSEWPAYTASEDVSLTFTAADGDSGSGGPTGQESGYRKDFADFWEDVIVARVS